MWTPLNSLSGYPDFAKRWMYPTHSSNQKPDSEDLFTKRPQLVLPSLTLEVKTRLNQRPLPRTSEFNTQITKKSQRVGEVVLLVLNLPIRDNLNNKLQKRKPLKKPSFERDNQTFRPLFFKNNSLIKSLFLKFFSNQLHLKNLSIFIYIKFI